MSKKRINKIDKRSTMPWEIHPRIALTLQDYNWLIEQAKKAGVLEQQTKQER